MTLKEWRKANRYTQAAFARLLFEKKGIKVDRSNVWHWENGTRPRKEVVAAIHEVTGKRVKAVDFARGRSLADNDEEPSNGYQG